MVEEDLTRKSGSRAEAIRCIQLALDEDYKTHPDVQSHLHAALRALGSVSGEEQHKADEKTYRVRKPFGGGVTMVKASSRQEAQQKAEALAAECTSVLESLQRLDSLLANENRQDSYGVREDWDRLFDWCFNRLKDRNV